MEVKQVFWICSLLGTLPEFLFFRMLLEDEYFARFFDLLGGAKSCKIILFLFFFTKKTTPLGKTIPVH